MATVSTTPGVSRAERANQRNAVLAGFLGWTLDAFDFFVLTFVIQDVATAFGKSRPDILLTVSVNCPDDRYDQLYLSNFALMRIKDGVSTMLYLLWESLNLKILNFANNLSVPGMMTGYPN